MRPEDFKNFTREELVAEYVHSWCRDFYGGNDDGSFRISSHGPTDLPTDPSFWKRRDEFRHELHNEIAKRYHVKREKIMWLSGIFDDWNGEMYIFNRRVKPLIRDAIRRLEAVENGNRPQTVKRLDDRWVDENGEDRIETEAMRFRAEQRIPHAAVYSCDTMINAD